MFFAALLKNSTTRRILFAAKQRLLFPTIVLEEIERHMPFLLERSGLTEGNFSKIFRNILARVEMVPEEFIRPHYGEALEIVKDIDINDLAFISCALAFPGSILWSEDKALKKQHRIRVLHTAKMLDLLRALPSGAER